MRRHRIASALIGVLLLAASAPAVSTAAEPERTLTTPTSWWWHTGVSAEFLADAVDSNTARIIDLEINKTSPPRFSAVLVRNEGVHAKGWWWYHGVTPKFVKARIDEFGARILDIERYVVNGKQRFAVILVPNDGAGAKSWWWYYGATPKFIADKVKANKARIIDLDTYVAGGKRRYAVVMVSNTGSDSKKWWWYYNVKPSFVKSELKKKGARLTDIEKHSATKLTVVMEKEAKKWWWYYDKNLTGLNDQIGRNGARLIDVERYQLGGKTRFAALMVNNSNALTTKVGAILRAGSKNANVGAYLKVIGGPVLASLQEGRPFEPASAIKVLHQMHAILAVQAGSASLSEPIDYYADPSDPTNKDICPKDEFVSAANKRTASLGEAMERMMEVSDNRTTRTIEERFGRAAINATAASLNMQQTVVASRLGCGAPGNFLTLHDAGLLYESAHGPLLTNQSRFEFFRRMFDEDNADQEEFAANEGIYSFWVTVVQEEARKKLGAASIDDPAVVSLRNAFVAEMEGSGKGGGYTLNCSGCSDYWRETRTSAGYLGLPFKEEVAPGTKRTVVRRYVYGAFLEHGLAPKAPKSQYEAAVKKINDALNNAQAELFRKEIAAALATW